VHPRRKSSPKTPAQISRLSGFRTRKAHYGPRDVLGDISRPAFGDVEGDHSKRGLAAEDIPTTVFSTASASSVSQ
jgi:hypothetical protein